MREGPLPGMGNNLGANQGSWSIAFIEYHIVIMAMLTRVTMVIILPRRAVQGQQL